MVESKIGRVKTEAKFPKLYNYRVIILKLIFVSFKLLFFSN